MSTRTWCEAEQRTQMEAKQAPVTGAPWLALLKFASGEWNVTAAERDLLLAYGLVQKSDAGIVLTVRGRRALDLSA
ncbi:MAG: hypothetical protein ACXWUS_04485 [Burkholderiales bacterium]